MSRRGKLPLVTLVLSVVVVGVVSGGGYFARLARAEAGASSTAAPPVVAQKKLTRKQLEGAKVLYEHNCARCHGSDGSGQTAMGRVFAAPNLADAGWWKKERPTDRRLTASIRDGRSQQRMPAFGQQLSKSDIAALVRLVRTFNGK